MCSIREYQMRILMCSITKLTKVCPKPPITCLHKSQASIGFCTFASKEYKHKCQASTSTQSPICEFKARKTHKLKQVHANHFIVAFFETGSCLISLLHLLRNQTTIASSTRTQLLFFSLLFSYFCKPRESLSSCGNYHISFPRHVAAV